MKKLLFVIFLAGLFFSVEAQEQQPFYFWNSVSLNIPVIQNSEINLKTRTYYNQTEQVQEMTYWDVSGLHRLSKWFRYGLAFRLTQIPKSDSNNYEYRPQLIGAFNQTWRILKFSSILRLEQRWFTQSKSHQRIYQNFFVSFPTLLTHWFKPVAGEELFLKLNTDHLHLARIFAGMGIYTAKHWGVDLFYVWQDSKKADYWQQGDAVALNLKFKI